QHSRPVPELPADPDRHHRLPDLRRGGRPDPDQLRAGLLERDPVRMHRAGSAVAVRGRRTDRWHPDVVRDVAGTTGRFGRADRRPAVCRGPSPVAVRGRLRRPAGRHAMGAQRGLLGRDQRLDPVQAQRVLRSRGGRSGLGLQPGAASIGQRAGRAAGHLHPATTHIGVGQMTIAQPRPQTAQRAAELEELDRRVLLHPHQTGARGERVVMVRGSGSTVWDASGNELLDAMGGSNWVAQVGHGRAELAQAAGQQLAELEYFTGFDIFSNERAIRLAQRLVGLAPAGMDRVFFTSGGSEGIETAMKLARLYFFHRGQPERTWFIARHFGYHGSTYGSGTLTGFPNMHEGIGQLLPHVEKVSPPTPYRGREMFGEGDLTDHLIAELSDTIDRVGPGNIAAMVGEPVMGGAGVQVPPADYWPRVRELLSKHGILLIGDEVVTAFGRTGSWFDSAARGMAADIVVTAKG